LTTTDSPPRSDALRPGWPAVEQLIRELSSSGANFASDLSTRNRITGYDSRRLSLESEHGTQWVEIASIKACWTTFEHLGRVSRRDVLEPGRCSAFMIALFTQVPGVTEHHDDEHYLLLPAQGAN
jgi:hypothetical protein